MPARLRTVTSLVAITWCLASCGTSPAATPTPTEAASPSATLVAPSSTPSATYTPSAANTPTMSPRVSTPTSPSSAAPQTSGGPSHSWRQTRNVKDADGYTYTVDIDLSIGDISSDPTNSKPGETMLSGPLVRGTIRVRNTTASRRTSVPDMQVAAFAILPKTKTPPVVPWSGHPLLPQFMDAPGGKLLAHVATVKTPAMDLNVDETRVLKIDFSDKISFEVPEAKVQSVRDRLEQASIVWILLDANGNYNLGIPETHFKGAYEAEWIDLSVLATSADWPLPVKK